jgi:hypothetical protein
MELLNRAHAGFPLKTGPHALRRQTRVNQRKKRTARIRDNYCMLLPVPMHNSLPPISAG